MAQRLPFTCAVGGGGSLPPQWSHLPSPLWPIPSRSSSYPVPFMFPASFSFPLLHLVFSASYVPPSTPPPPPPISFCFLNLWNAFR